MDSLVCVVRVPNLSHNSLFKDRYNQQGVGGGGGGGGGTGILDFKWQGWSNGDKNKKKNPWTKI